MSFIGFSSFIILRSGRRNSYQLLLLSSSINIKSSVALGRTFIEYPAFSNTCRCAKSLSQHIQMKLHSAISSFLIVAILAGLCISVNGKGRLFNYNDTLKGKEGVIIRTKFSKQVAVLLRDTTLSGNRFDYRWFRTGDTGIMPSFNYQFPAFLVDSALASYCDSIFIENPTNKRISLNSYPKKNLSFLTKDNVRLYIGFIDDLGDKIVVVQFISIRKFKRDRIIYSKELFLVVPTKELHFAVFNVGKLMDQ